MVILTFLAVVLYINCTCKSRQFCNSRYVFVITISIDYCHWRLVVGCKQRTLKSQFTFSLRIFAPHDPKPLYVYVCLQVFVCISSQEMSVSSVPIQPDMPFIRPIIQQWYMQLYYVFQGNIRAKIQIKTYFTGYNFRKKNV